ncbi:MAG: CGGC domain-containing protein [Bacteroidaceae bacterium]|jgi:predicted metal-binding protein
MKIGIIRCMQTEDFCPGAGCFKAMREHKGSFAGIDEEIEIVGFANCGGCPGKKSVLRAKLLADRGADTIAFASCIQKGTPIGYPCPFHRKMKALIEAKYPGIRILDYTHDAPPLPKE